MKSATFQHTRFMKGSSLNANDITLQDLAGRPVFALRLKRTLLPRKSTALPGNFDLFVQQGHDVLVPLAASGIGRVAKSKYVAAQIQTLIAGQFCMFAEMFQDFPNSDLNHNPRLIPAVRGRSVLSGKHFVESFGAAVAVMALHPSTKWTSVTPVASGDGDENTEDTRQRREDEAVRGIYLGLEPGQIAGLFLHIDLRIGVRPPGELRGFGFSMDDEQLTEASLKIPLFSEWSPVQSPGKAQHAVSARKLLPRTPARHIRFALAWAEDAQLDVAVGVTKKLWSGLGRDTKKLARASDLAVITSAEQKLLVEGTGFSTLGGLPLYLALQS